MEMRNILQSKRARLAEINLELASYQAQVDEVILASEAGAHMVVLKNEREELKEGIKRLSETLSKIRVEEIEQYENMLKRLYDEAPHEVYSFNHVLIDLGTSVLKEETVRKRIHDRIKQVDSDLQTINLVNPDYLRFYKHHLNLNDAIADYQKWHAGFDEWGVKQVSHQVIEYVVVPETKDDIASIEGLVDDEMLADIKANKVLIWADLHEYIRFIQHAGDKVVVYSDRIHVDDIDILKSIAQAIGYAYNVAITIIVTPYVFETIT